MNRAAINNFLASVGAKTLQFLLEVDRFSRLFGATLYWLVAVPFKGKKIRVQATIEQMVLVGFNSVPIVAMIAFFVGLILGMQAAYQLKPFGAAIYMADLVGVSVTRELGPMLTAIIVAGRSGSAIAAEIGTMKVAEEVDALKTMGLNPIPFLVVPKVVAMVLMLPCLTLIADLVGILGGLFIALFSEHIDFWLYFNQTAEALVMKDFLTGLFKSGFFALMIATIGCHQGFSVVGGAEGVGKRTTAAVVASIFMIIATNVFFTGLFYSTF